MRNIKNYTVSFIGDLSIPITKEQAESVYKAWNSNARFVIIGGEGYAVHQIVSIRRRANYDLRKDLIANGYLKIGERIDAKWKNQLEIGNNQKHLL